MSETPLPVDPREARCPHCDTVLEAQTRRCPLCGAVAAQPATAARPATPPPARKPAEMAPVRKAEPKPPEPSLSPLPTSSFRWRSPIGTSWLLSLAIMLITAVALVLIWQNRAAAPAAVADLPATPLSPAAAPTLTPTITASPTEAPTLTPTVTLTPTPTDTPQPPRVHRVSPNETLYGLGFVYKVSVDSILALNNREPDDAIRVNEELLIPWPTPTPPLAPVSLEIGGETIVADPAGCELYVIQSGDNLFAIAANRRIPLVALQQVNRLTDQSLIRPGDTLCIPTIIRGGLLPPTPGPSPTPTVTPPPAGPQLLFPAREATISYPDGPGLLQWVHVKALMAEEYYMVELVNLSRPDSRPYRAFTRDTAVRLPLYLRPEPGETDLFRWRVTIVRITGERADGQFTYTYGGTPSQELLFYWASVQ
jgi:LysM repeat protein